MESTQDARVAGPLVVGDDVRTAYSRGGTWIVQWRPVGGPVPNNEHFELDLWLWEAGERPTPVSGATVAISGWMPDHEHGMIRRPRATDNGDGSYRVQGMLLHMGGFWQLFVDVIVEGTSERVQFDLTL